MHIREIAKVAKILAEPLDKVTINEAASSNLKEIQNYGPVRDVLKNLEENKLFPYARNQFKEFTNILNNITGKVVVDTASAYRFTSQTKILRECLISFSDQILQIMPNEKADGLFIKLPESKDFDDFNETIKILDRSLNKTADYINSGEKIKINSVDNGSIWIELTIGLGILAKVIGGIIWAAVALHKKYLEIERYKEVTRSLKLQNEVNELVSGAIDKQLEDMLSVEAKAIIQANSLEEKIDLQSKIAFSIKELSGLISKGAVFNISHDAPPDVQSAFPDMTNIDKIESKAVKLIERSNEP